MVVVKKNKKANLKANAGYEPHSMQTANNHTDSASVPTESNLNETATSQRGLVEEEFKHPKSSPTKHDNVQTSDDLKAHLLQNDANSTNKYMLDSDVNKNQMAPQPEVNKNMTSKTLSNLNELKNNEKAKQKDKKKASKEANDTCNCSIF